MLSPVPFEPPHDAVPLKSSSGARFGRVPALSALGLFRRLSAIEHRSMEWADAWGAFEDSDDLIGACAMVRTTDSSYRAHVAVVPERRRLEIGRELLNLIVDQAMERGARTVRGSYPFGASGAGRLIDGLDLTSARRTANGQVDVVVFFPSAMKRPEGTDIGISGSFAADEPLDS